jgi:hypothetical protein
MGCLVTKTLLTAVLLCQIEPTRAASPTQMYLAARDRYIAREAAMRDKGGRRSDHSCDEACSGVASARQERELSDLERQLRSIVGQLDLDGFPREGTINLATLTRELGFGQLDGLAFDSTDKNTRIVVTTNALLESWLLTVGWAHIPRDVDSAVRSEAFYTQGLDDDAAFNKFAEVPVPTPPTARLVYAMLVQRAQDYTLGPPDELIVTVVQREKIFVVSQRNFVAFSRIAACDALARDYQAKEDVALAAYRASKLNDKAGFNKAEKFESEGDIAYRQCFGEHVKEQPAFAVAIRQAKSIVASLTLK